MSSESVMAARGRVDAIWRIEGPRVVATLARATGDLGLAEDLAQDAVLAALEQWPRTGVPRRPGAWLTTVAKRRAIDGWRRREGLDERYRLLADDLARDLDDVRAVESPIDDDLLRLVFIACHPMLSRGAQVALTLRVVGGLTTPEIARMLLISPATVQQRIVRAKRTLADARAPFETPAESQWHARLGGVLAVLHLIFTEGYAATSGERWLRPELAGEALRLGRVLSGLLPREPEVHGLLALMELQAARFPARVDGDGNPVLLADQDRAKWDRAQIRRGAAALALADQIGRGRGNYCLQAAIAECHAVAPSVEDTDWGRIVVLYEALGRLAPSPIVELNRAVAVSQASGPAAALGIVDSLAAAGALRGSHLLPSVRGELLSQLGRIGEARAELFAAAELAANERVRKVLRDKAATLGAGLARAGSVPTMSFTHIVAFSFHDGTDAAARAGEALNALAKTVPEVKEFRCGPDAGVSAGNADFGIVAVFDSEADYEVYRDHPEHQRILKEILIPNIAQRTCVQLNS